MKIKTSELTGAALDWAVSKCEGVTAFWLAIDEFNPQYEFGEHHYSTDWSQGGPIIEREKITVEYTGDPDTWCACIMADQEVYGPTFLIAAMRCFVASKLGDEVEIPEELT